MFGDIALTTNRTQMRETTRERVRDAAAAMFRERGFAATTIRDIAASCGVSAGTVMSVGDKDSLLVQTFDVAIARTHDARSGTAPHRDLPPEDALAALVHPFVALFTADEGLAREYASVVVSGRAPSALFARLATVLIREFAQVLGVPDHPRTEALACAAYFAYVGVLMSWAAAPGASPVQLERRLAETFAAVCGSTL